MSKITCNACPVLCQISPGRLGACDRYGNEEGVLVRTDALVVLRRPTSTQERREELFVSGVNASTTYPDYKPAPFIVASRADNVDTVTVVTEGIFSYCSFKVKVDTDRFLGAEQSNVRCDGEVVGHVTTTEYGSQMLSLGGVHHLTGGSKKEGRIACQVMEDLGNKKAVELQIEGGATIVVQANRAPIVNGVVEQRMRVGCGSAAIGMFAQQWFGHCDEVIVIDDHITGLLSEHQAGAGLAMRLSGLRVRGRRSTPGRYFQVANPGQGWGGTDIVDPLSVIESIDPKLAWPGLRLLIVSTTGEDSAWFVLDEQLAPQAHPMPDAVRAVVDRVGENCEPSLCTVLFLGGAGGSLRAGVTENPIALTRSIKESLVSVTSGGAPAYLWPGGGIMMMVDVAQMPDNSFGSVPTPAIVAPVEFTMRRQDFEALGGHLSSVRELPELLAQMRAGGNTRDTTRRVQVLDYPSDLPWPGKAPSKP